MKQMANVKIIPERQNPNTVTEPPKRSHLKLMHIFTYVVPFQETYSRYVQVAGGEKDMGTYNLYDIIMVLPPIIC